MSKPVLMSKPVKDYIELLIDYLFFVLGCKLQAHGGVLFGSRLLKCQCEVEENEETFGFRYEIAILNGKSPSITNIEHHDINSCTLELQKEEGNVFENLVECNGSFDFKRDSFEYENLDYIDKLLYTRISRFFESDIVNGQ